MLHIVCSALATGAGSYLSEYRWHWDEETGNRFGVALALTLGLSKEINDKTVGYGYFSWKDLAADIVGVFIGLLITGLW